MLTHAPVDASVSPVSSAEDGYGADLSESKELNDSRDVHTQKKVKPEPTQRESEKGKRRRKTPAQHQEIRENKREPVSHSRRTPTPAKGTRTKSSTKSPYFPLTKSILSKPRVSRKDISCIPFPPLSAPSFGLAQERLRHDPLHLLVACIFLTKTRGAVSMPMFYQLIAKYPDANQLASADFEDVMDIFAHLGLQNQRATRVIKLAQVFRDVPPHKGARYRSLHYPNHGDGKDVRPKESIDEDDKRVGWEIAHLPGVGPYGFDSWRIFCRDRLRDLDDLSEMEQEWTRVLPLDKELRAYLRWRWLKSGWVWDPLTGNKRKAESAEMLEAEEGGVMVEGNGDGRIDAGEGAEPRNGPQLDVVAGGKAAPGKDGEEEQG